MDDVMKQFCADRDAALLSLDETRIRAYAQKYSARMPRDSEMFWCAVHKARTAIPGLPMEARTLSKRWLIEHGSAAMDDGDVPI